MSKIIEIKCDACEKDLTYTGNCDDYYLTLSDSSKSPWYMKDGGTGGVVTSMAIEPELGQSKHFCNLRCLGLWWRHPKEGDRLMNRPHIYKPANASFTQCWYCNKSMDDVLHHGAEGGG